MPADDVPSRFAVDFAGLTLLGIYRVERKIADGGMGSVWLGEDTNLGRKVVVKVPHVRFLGEAGFRARFKREITELVRLEHPSIVRILAQGTHEEIPFFVLQYLGGGSLEARLAEAGACPRGIDVVVPWLRTIAATLDFVHGRGVVHRDVKPENILFDEEGHVFLSDFGVVKALDEELNVTDAGTGVGSPRYMAPEQGFGRQVGGSADQYGLATTVYEAITGKLPFEGESALELLLKKHKEQPIQLAEMAPELPAACAAAVMRGLAAEPGDRFPSCRDFATAFLAGAGIFEGTPPTGTAAAADRAARSPERRALTAALAVAVLVAIVLLVGSLSGWFSPGASRDAETGEEAIAHHVILLSPGAEPRRVLRYHPSPGAEDTTAISIATERSDQTGEQEPVTTTLPGVSMRLKLTVTDVAQNGDLLFAWECTEMNLDVAAGTPAPILDAIRSMTQSLEGTSGTGRQSARGVHRELGHDAPPPADVEVQRLSAMITDIVEQISTPLPKEPVGIGARWEVTNAKNHIEGVRVTQTATYELLSLGKNEARLRMYVVVAALNQTIEHPEIPAAATARVTRVHGDGGGELVVDFDRLGGRSVAMTVETRTELSVMGADDEEVLELTQVQEFSYESRRE